MLKRKAYARLLDWSKSDHAHTALLVTGARQIGKSYLVRKLGTSAYDVLVEINLVDNTAARNALAQAVDAQDLIRRISLFSPAPLVEGRTLIFIDEIQELPDLMTMAKFLVQDGRFDYAFSGSMLGTELKRVRSYPVGSVTEVQMRPMDFEEFCWANQVSDEALATVRDACCSMTPVPDYLHEALLRYFRTYVAVGGMPEVVQRFVTTGGDFASVYGLQTDLVRGYQNDIAKYAGTRALNVKAIFDLLPLQLDSDSRRFVLNSIDDNARYERYRQDFVWLVNAGVGLKTDLVRDPKQPLGLTARAGNFKLYESDTGMLVARYGRDAARAVYLDDPHPNLGAIFENVVAQELFAQGHQLFYYMNKKRGEVDFVVAASQGAVLPIEVKSGRNARAHAALDHLLANDEYRVPQGIVLSRLNVERNGKVLYLPWYATFCLPLFTEPQDNTPLMAELPKI